MVEGREGGREGEERAPEYTARGRMDANNTYYLVTLPSYYLVRYFTSSRDLNGFVRI